MRGLRKGAERYWKVGSGAEQGPTKGMRVINSLKSQWSQHLNSSLEYSNQGK